MVQPSSPRALLARWLSSRGKTPRADPAFLTRFGYRFDAIADLVLRLYAPRLDDPDAFVLRVAARVALREAPASKEADIRGILARLSAEAEVIERFLEADYARLETYVRNLKKGAVRGRTVEEIVSDPAVRSEFLRDVTNWAKVYACPSFESDEKTLIKLQSFLHSRLP